MKNITWEATSKAPYCVAGPRLAAEIVHIARTLARAMPLRGERTKLLRIVVRGFYVYLLGIQNESAVVVVVVFGA